MERLHDVESDRDVWVVELETAADWPAETPWSCAGFGLFVALERVVDATALAEKAKAQGLVVAFSWGPGCAIVEEAFDEVIAAKDAITSSHPDESLAEALELFLAVDAPAKDCGAWCIAAFGPKTRASVKRALERRGAKRRS